MRRKRLQLDYPAAYEKALELRKAIRAAQNDGATLRALRSQLCVLLSLADDAHERSKRVWVQEGDEGWFPVARALLGDIQGQQEVAAELDLAADKIVQTVIDVDASDGEDGDMAAAPAVHGQGMSRNERNR